MNLFFSLNNIYRELIVVEIVRRRYLGKDLRSTWRENSSVPIGGTTVPGLVVINIYSALYFYYFDLIVHLRYHLKYVENLDVNYTSLPPHCTPLYTFPMMQPDLHLRHRSRCRGKFWIVAHNFKGSSKIDIFLLYYI